MKNHAPTDESEEPKRNPMIDGCNIAAGHDARDPTDEGRDRLHQTEYENARYSLVRVNYQLVRPVTHDDIGTSVDGCAADLGHIL
jgi:hypothetical protein